MKKFIASLAIAFVAIVALSSSAISGATSEKDVAITGGVYNTCCGEWVGLSGMGHVVINKNGSHINVNGLTGAGYDLSTGNPTGTTYTQQGSATQNVSSTSNANGTTTFNFNLNIRMKNAAGCSFVLHWHQHVTVNANGDITSTTSEYDITCN